MHFVPAPRNDESTKGLDLRSIKLELTFPDYVKSQKA
jgi:hypothetical protein